MEIKIGITDMPHEIVVDVEQTPEEMRQLVAGAGAFMRRIGGSLFAACSCRR